LAAGRLLGGQSRLRAELPAPQNQTDPLPIRRKPNDGSDAGVEWFTIAELLMKLGAGLN
jgi:hypothetical protein